MIFKDDLGREVVLDRYPEKIVSLVPSITETVVAVGKGEALCGVTRFCVHPASIRQEKRVVGGTKTIKTEVVRSLQPHLILSEKSENPKEQVLALAKDFPVFVFDIHHYESALQMLDMLFGLLNAPKAIVLKQEIEQQFASLPDFAPMEKALYLIWKKPWMAAGKDTFIGSMMEKAGFDSVVESGYPEVTREHFRRADTILLSTEPYPFGTDDARRLQQEFPHKKVLVVDGELFAWYGSRMLQTVEYIKRLRGLTFESSDLP